MKIKYRGYDLNGETIMQAFNNNLFSFCWENDWDCTRDDNFVCTMEGPNCITGITTKDEEWSGEEFDIIPLEIYQSYAKSLYGLSEVEMLLHPLKFVRDGLVCTEWKIEQI